MPKKIPLNFEKYKKEASKSCFICDIVNGGEKREKHTIFHEDENFICFLNNYPTQEAQTLVCPKKHLCHIFADTDEETYRQLMDLARKTGLAIQKVTGANRMYLASLGSNQVNSHIHIHILPISSNLGYEQQQLAAFDHNNGVYQYTKKERQLLANLIKKEMNRKTTLR